MSVGTKNRLKQTADVCKEHLRTTYPSQLVLVDDFNREIEGVGKAQDITKWGQFTDLSQKNMLDRLDDTFKKWLGGDV